MNSAASTFNRLLKILTDASSEFIPPEGASTKKISEIEDFFGHELPAGLREIYRIHDGEFSYGSSDTLGLFFGYEFLSLDHSRELLRGFRRGAALLAEAGGVDDYSYASIPENSVANVFCDKKWFPIAGFFSGNHLAIDFSPGPSGSAGQIINFGPDDFIHFQIATGFDDFLNLLESKYRNRIWHPIFSGENWNLYDELKGVDGRLPR
ncbi:MAG: SMI1/KNR4 family protein [Roseateles sp.]|uniref:SMI1/KNR4 family protein n=1 Tax=Roseateles sp. TaxID=1971397 RepID=UPI0039EBE5B6